MWVAGSVLCFGRILEYTNLCSFFKVISNKDPRELPSPMLLGLPPHGVAYFAFVVILAALGCGGPRGWGDEICNFYHPSACLRVYHIKHPKPLIAEAVDNMQTDSGFGILYLQSRCISPYLFRIRFLKFKILDSCLHFCQIGIGIILEFDHPASALSLIHI